MANFMEELWNSIFVAGPTPTLLVATNATFGVLQLLLLVLLATTYSVHFFVLSILSGGLWWAINWFATELKASEIAQRQQEQAQDEPKTKKSDTDELDAADDTETEMASSSFIAGKGKQPAQVASSSYLAPSDDLRQRKSLADSSGDVSTDSEWDKLSETEQ